MIFFKFLRPEKKLILKQLLNSFPGDICMPNGMKIFIFINTDALFKENPSATKTAFMERTTFFVKVT